MIESEKPMRGRRRMREQARSPCLATPSLPCGHPASGRQSAGELRCAAKVVRRVKEEDEDEEEGRRRRRKEKTAIQREINNCILYLFLSIPCITFLLYIT